MIDGIGRFIWSLRNCEGGDPIFIWKMARIAGIRHALIKIQDGLFAYDQLSYAPMVEAFLMHQYAFQGKGCSFS